MKALLAIVLAAACSSSLPQAPQVLQEFPMLIVIAGQSNAVGGAAVTDITDAATEAAYSLPYSAVHVDWQLAQGQAVPIAWEFFSGELQPRDAGGAGLRMGAELSLGRHLGAIGAIGKFAVTGTTLANRWHPDATYPAGDPLGNLYTQFIAYIQALELELGMQTTAIVWIQGNADGAAEGTANAYGENLQTFLDQVRADLGRPIVFVFDELPTIDAPFASTVRAEQHAFALANAGRGVAMVETGDLAMRDTDHYTADSFVLLGQRFGAALLPLVGGGYIMGGTTYKQIRDAQTAVLEALSPSLLPAVGRFRVWQPIEGVPSFAAWADTTAEPFRVFWIESNNDNADERYRDEQTEAVVHTQTLFVAYPNQVTWGGERMDDLIESDATDLTKAIGLRGYGSYAELGEGAHAVMRIGQQVLRGKSARILAIQFQLEYDRHIS